MSVPSAVMSLRRRKLNPSFLRILLPSVVDVVGRMTTIRNQLLVERKRTFGQRLKYVPFLTHPRFRSVIY